MHYRVMPKSDQLPNALYRAAQVKALDALTIEQYGIAGSELMLRAGSSAFTLMQEHWPQARQVTVLAGTGNNAGDGFVLASLARAADLDVQVLQLGDRANLQGDALLYAQQYQREGGIWNDYQSLPRRCDLIIDAMLGTGLQRGLKGQWLETVQATNVHKAPVLALDLPSGLQADTGVALGAAIHAEATLSFVGLKQGMFTADGVDCCGKVFFDALEIPAQAYASQILAARRIDWVKQSSRFGPRRRSAHKGHYGHVLVIGGDLGFGGAVRLAAEAAARCGAGLVTVATRGAHVPALLAARPELMVHAVDHEQALEPLLYAASVVVLGPGLGRTGWGRAMYQQAIQAQRPMLLDADALNLLSEEHLRQENWILTPHPGEAARLLGVCTAEIHLDRFAAVNQLQQRFSGTVVLKGAGTLIASQDGKPPALCSDGNPGMATGGMGDVLSGVIAGLLAQGWQQTDAAELGVCLHAAAADRAAGKLGERGLLAADLMPHLQALVNQR